MSKAKQVVDTLCRDAHGNIVIAQKPNAPLIVGLISLVLTRVLPYGQLNFLAALIAYGALFTWAWLEIFQGVTLVRRIVGALVMVLIVSSKLM